MMIGWIKLYRLLLESAVFQNAYALQVFLYLLLKAAYKEMKIPVGNKNIVLQPGQLLYGRKSVAQKLNLGEGKLRGIMNYLVENGSIEIEGHSRYSVVTIVNWEKYQVGEVPEFLFDVDFLDEEDDETEPAKNRMQMQSGTGFQNYENDFSANREPQYNNINKYKNNKINNNKKIKENKENKTKENKTKENNNKIKENKTKEKHKNITNIKNTENISYRQSDDIVYDCGVVERVAGPDTSQEMLLSDGAVISKGKVVCEDIANRSGVDSQTEAFSALSAMDDAALDAYFESCAFADFDTVDENHAYDIYDDDVYDRNELAPLLLDDSDFADMLDFLDDYRRPGYEFITEMVYDLTPRDVEQLDAMFQCHSAAAVGYDDYGCFDKFSRQKNRDSA